MKTLRVMDSTGDSMVKFEDESSTAEARALFERMTGKGAAVFAVNRGDGQADKRVKDFDALESENIIVPAITGG